MSRIIIKSAAKISRVRADGTVPVSILIRHNGTRCEYQLPISLPFASVDENGQIRDIVIRRRVDDEVMAFHERLGRIDPFRTEKMTAREILDTILGMQDVNTFRLDFLEFTKEFIELKKSVHVRNNYLSSVKSYMAFLGSGRVDIRDITSGNMLLFEKWLRAKYGDSARAVSLYTSHIRTVFNAARARYNGDEYGEVLIRDVFAHYKPPKPPKPHHRDVPAELIQRMINDRPSLDGAERIAVSAFLMSFALRGLNAPDLYELVRPDKNGIIVFQRAKTRTVRDDRAESELRIPAAARFLFDEFADKTARGRHLLNFHNRYGSARNFEVCVARGLRTYKARIKYNGELTYYSARHAWATLAYKWGMSTYLISDGLTHSDAAVKVANTVYINKDWSKVIEENEKFVSEVVAWGISQ